MHLHPPLHTVIACLGEVYPIVHVYLRHCAPGVLCPAPHIRWGICNVILLSRLGIANSLRSLRNDKPGLIYLADNVCCIVRVDCNIQASQRIQTVVYRAHDLPVVGDGEGRNHVNIAGKLIEEHRSVHSPFAQTCHFVTLWARLAHILKRL